MKIKVLISFFAIYLLSGCQLLPENARLQVYRVAVQQGNVVDIEKTLKESFRILKPGGRFMCLEFSKIDNEILSFLYKQYSKTIPFIGKYVAGSDKPYKYLIKSIEKFHNQEQLAELMRKNGFSNVEFRNVSNGISAIHSGWKI